MIYSFSKHLLWLLGALFAAVLTAGEMQIIATGDLHGRLDKLAALAPLMQKYPDAVKIDLGDLFHGDPVNDLLSGVPAFEALSLLKYDFFIPGNHDFELPPEQLSKSLQSFSGEILSQNLPGQNRWWRVVKKGGIVCGIIGSSGNSVARNARFFPGLSSLQELSAIDQALAELRKQHCDLIILARHGGDYFDGKTAGSVLRDRPEIKLMLCAHTHREIPGRRSGRTLIVQPGAYGSSAALIRIQKIPRPGGKGNSIRLLSSLEKASGHPAEAVLAIRKKHRRENRKLLEQNVVEIDDITTFTATVLQSAKQLSGSDCATVDLPSELPRRLTRYKFLQKFPYRNYLCTVKAKPEEIKAFLKEHPAAGFRRTASEIPEGKTEVVLALSTFQLSRSKALKQCQLLKICNIFERDIITGENIH